MNLNLGPNDVDYIKANMPSDKDVKNAVIRRHKAFALNNLQQKWYQKQQKGDHSPNRLEIKPLILKDGETHYLNRYQRSLYAQLDKALDMQPKASNTPPKREIEVVRGQVKYNKTLKKINLDPHKLTSYNLKTEAKAVNQEITASIAENNKKIAAMVKEAQRPRDKQGNKLYDKILADHKKHILNVNQIAAYNLLNNSVDTAKAPDKHYTGRDAWGSYSGKHYYNSFVLNDDLVKNATDDSEAYQEMLGTDNLDKFDMSKMQPNADAENCKSMRQLVKMVKAADHNKQIKKEQNKAHVNQFDLIDDSAKEKSVPTKTTQPDIADDLF